MRDTLKARRYLVGSVAELGEAARRARKQQRFSIAELSPLVNLGERFISEVERGKETAALGKVLELLDGLGLGVLIVPKPLAKKLDHQLSFSRDLTTEPLQ